MTLRPVSVLNLILSLLKFILPFPVVVDNRKALSTCTSFEKTVPAGWELNLYGSWPLVAFQEAREVPAVIVGT